MVAIDELFFKSLEVILAEDQLTRLERVRCIRECERARVIPSRIPGSNEDVSRLAVEVCEGDANAIVDSNAFDALLATYETAAAGLWMAHERRMLEALMLEHQLFGPTMDSTAAEANQQAFDRMREFREGTYQLEERLRVLNADFIHRATPLLSQSAAALLRQQYYTGAFPEVYPDPHDVTPVLVCFEQAFASSKTIAAALAELRKGYLQRHDTISARMIERHLAWRAWFRIHSVNDQAAFDAYRDSMLTMQAERAAAADGVLTQALSVLDSMPDSCSMLVADYREAVANHQPQVSGFQLRP